MQVRDQMNRGWSTDFLGSNSQQDDSPDLDSRNSDLDDWKKWRSWYGGIIGKTSRKDDAGFVFGIRFEQEPNGSDNEWQLNYFAASIRDPSLRIDLKQWWGLSKVKQKQWLIHFGSQFEQQLLIQMGHAARICPLLWGGMETEHPSGIEVDMDTAYTFLKEDALVLESAGFKILLPSWWTPQGRKRARVRINAAGRASPTQTSQNSGYFSLSSLVQYNYQLSVGGEPISEQEWQQLVNAKTPLVRFRGEWMELDRTQMSQMIQLWRQQEQEEAPVTFGEMLKRMAEAESEMTEFAFDEVLQNILNSLRHNKGVRQLEDPPGLDGELRPYQKQGLSWLATMEALGLNPCLADDMGLGKTIQVLALLLHERDCYGAVESEQSDDKLPTLLIAPTSVLSNWRKEVEKFAPELNCIIHHGGDRIRSEKEFAKAIAGTNIVITSFALASKDRAVLKKGKWRRIVVDEAQNIKNPKTAQTRAICSLNAPLRIAITGTPIENRLTDLWSIFHFLNPGYLGTQAQFKRAYETPVQRDRDFRRLTQLQQLVQPFILRRLKSDKTIIADLPDKVEQKVFCNLTKEQASLYQSVIDDTQNMLDEVDGMERRGLILSTLMKLKQICNHPAQFLQDGSAFSEVRSHKLSRLVGMIEEALAESVSMLVFTQFTEVGSQLESLLRRQFGCPIYYLHGGSTPKRREQMIERFQNSESAAGVFILSLKAGGVGINLTQANHVFHFDRWWNPAVENQATDRAYRIGQEKKVFVHKMVTLGTLEERIDKMIEDKQAVADSISGSDEKWLTELDNDAFQHLIQLNRETIMES